MTHILEILACLSRAEVDFVLIGGAAAAAYGSTMVTQDVDVCADMSRTNLEKVARALGPFDPVHRMVPDKRPFTVEDARTMTFRNLYLQTSIGQLDLLGEVLGVGDFSAVWDESEVIELENFEIRILSLGKLIESKEAMGRPRDLENAEILRIIQKGFDESE